MWAVIIPALVAALVFYTLASEEVDEMEPVPIPAPAQPAPLATNTIWHTLAIIAVMVLTALLGKTAPVINVPTPTVPPVGQAAFGAAQQTEGFAPLRRLFARNMRAHAAKEFRENGFTRIGGAEGAMSKERAEFLASHLDDDMIMTGMQQTGALGDGTFLQFLRDVLRWPFDHPDAFLALLKLLLPFLLAL
jgi:hypothetical protein